MIKIVSVDQRQYFYSWNYLGNPESIFKLVGDFFCSLYERSQAVKRSGFMILREQIFHTRTFLFLKKQRLLQMVMSSHYVTFLRTKTHKAGLSAAALLLCASCPAIAADQDSLDYLVITATRLEEKTFDVPPRWS